MKHELAPIARRIKPVIQEITINALKGACYTTLNHLVEYEKEIYGKNQENFTPKKIKLKDKK